MNPKSVLTLVTKKNLSASDMTHLLSDAGAGDMRSGIIAVVKCAVATGFLAGAAIPTAIQTAKKAKELIEQARVVPGDNKIQEPLPDSQTDDLRSQPQFSQIPINADIDQNRLSYYPHLKPERS